jgi:hypothetical protein
MKIFLIAVLFSVSGWAQVALPNLEGHYKSDGKFDITTVVEKIEVPESRNINSEVDQLKKDGYLCLSDTNPGFTCYKYLFKNEISAAVASLLTQRVQGLLKSNFDVYPLVDKNCTNQTDQKCKVQQKMVYNQNVAYECEYDFLSAQQNWMIYIKERNALFMTKIQPFTGYLRVADLNTEIQYGGRGYLGYYVSNFFLF